MAEELKGLIEKIQEEGVKTAETRAKAIEEEAGAAAKIIIGKADKKAEDIVREAKEKVARMEESGKTSLKQAGRNLMISLHKEVNDLLENIVTSRVKEALTPEEMVKIITIIAKEAATAKKNDITISLNKKDLEKMEKGLFAELKKQLKHEITLKSSEDIRGGFTISYDEGKSHYDFSDEALAEYIGSYLRPKLAEMLKR